MKIYNKIISIMIILGLSFVMLTESAFADTYKLELTGDLYDLTKNTPVLKIPNVDAYNELDGKTLGFNLVKNGVVERQLPALPGECITKNERSPMIFDAINKLLKVQPGGLEYQLTIGASNLEAVKARTALESALSRSLKNQKESIIVKYSYNVPGEKTISINVNYIVGGRGSSDASYYNSSGFINTPVITSKDIEVPNSQISKIDDKKMDTAEILKALRDILNDSNTKQIGVNIGDKSELSRDFLKEINKQLYKDKEIIFQKLDLQQQLLYRWQLKTGTGTISSVKERKVFDLTINTTNEQISKLVSGKYAIISFAEKDSFPDTFEVSIKLDLTGFNTPDKLKIYRVNQQTGDLEEKKISLETKFPGMLTFNIGYGGDYIITN